MKKAICLFAISYAFMFKLIALFCIIKYAWTCSNTCEMNGWAVSAWAFGLSGLPGWFGFAGLKEFSGSN